MRADLRAAANRDVADAVAYYRNEAGLNTAAEFVDALETAVSHLRRHPFTGSLRFAYELEIPELRCWSLQRFSYAIFYIVDDDRIDIWRILHARRDIPAYLTPESRE